MTDYDNINKEKEFTVSSISSRFFDMDNTQITELLKQMKTVEDLAALLDFIKRNEKKFGSIRYGITEKMLRHFSSDAIAPKRFRKFHIKKKSGGLREIKAPCRQLDVILTCLNIMLGAIYSPSDAAMGFTHGRSVLDNAQVHVGHNYVFNIDLKDFFSSIPQARVWKRLQLPPFNFTQEVANVVAGLCCSYDEVAGANVLPQGSPASPLLTNAICDKLDRRMKGVAKRFGLHYSRYADDMSFSSMHNVYKDQGEFRSEIQRVISEQGFHMNDSKTSLQKAGARQEVTGLTVNAVANVSRKHYISDLRWILSVWEKEGYAKAYAKFYPKYKHDKGYIKKGEPVMENVIEGKLNYLKMVRGNNNPAYQKLAARFAVLQEPIFIDKETDKANSYVYVQPYSLAEFQELFHTSIILEVSRDRKVIGRCKLDGRDKVLAISKSTQKSLCPDIEGKLAGEVLLSDGLAKCFVTLCRNKGKNFWLITMFEPKRSSYRKTTPDRLLDIWEKEGIDAAVKVWKDVGNNNGRTHKPNNTESELTSDTLSKDLTPSSESNIGSAGNLIYLKTYSIKEFKAMTKTPTISVRKNLPTGSLFFYYKGENGGSSSGYVSRQRVPAHPVISLVEDRSGHEPHKFLLMHEAPKNFKSES